MAIKFLNFYTVGFNFTFLKFLEHSVYLAQSTLVLGCGIITYTDPVLPVSGFVISLGHMIKGFGKSVSHFGKSFFHVAVFFEQVVDFRP